MVFDTFLNCVQYACTSFAEQRKYINLYGFNVRALGYDIRPHRLRSYVYSSAHVYRRVCDDDRDARAHR